MYNGRKCRDLKINMKNFENNIYFYQKSSGFRNYRDTVGYFRPTKTQPTNQPILHDKSRRQQVKNVTSLFVALFFCDIWEISMWGVPKNSLHRIKYRILDIIWRCSFTQIDWAFINKPLFPTNLLLKPVN